MYTVPGCKINEKIYESPASLVYRGIRETDQLPVILKVLKGDYPSRNELVRYRQEYEITRSLNLEGVIKTYGQEKYGNTLAIILEDFGGDSLKILRERINFPPGDILRLAIQLARILGRVHEAQVIHKDINPSNIVLNPGTGELKLIDFGLSTKLSRELPVLKNPERLEGTLAYMSPEQTGRMNRSLDYRTDYYALGVTLYELFSGRLPFTSTDPMELVHCHLAREPAPLTDFSTDIPENLSLVVLKLLAKRAEERYQTTQGLITDLELCLNQRNNSTAFRPGENDLSDHFQLPQKLYGRNPELKTLLRAAERSAVGASEALFVAGFSGVGKSALVKELHRTLIRPRGPGGKQRMGLRNGYFISGKFAQFHRHIPYSAVRDAFRDLTRQLLTENEMRLSRWKSRLLTALGPNASIMTEFLPELRPVLGEQPPVLKLGAAENRNRFTLVMRNFVEVFLGPEHCLSIFLDDLQWADLASLDFIEMICADTQHLFFIGAYRDNEVDPSHPMAITMNNMRKAETCREILTLKPLELIDVRRYIAEATGCNPSDTNELAELIKHKTDGNPFFMGEFLKAMEREKLLEYNSLAGYRIWDMKAIQKLNITDNVVDLIAGQINQLAADTKSALTKAACLGNVFDLETLAMIHEKSTAETAGDLWPALELNMLMPLHEQYKIAALTPLDIPVHGVENLFVYKFSHDRIAEASYKLLPERERIELHLKAGRLLSPRALEDTAGILFAVVEHLNLARDLFEEQSERDAAANLNLRAGTRAQASAAYKQALGYYKIALELLGHGGKNPWSHDYNTTLVLTTQAAETAMLARDFKLLNEFVEATLHQATSAQDKARVYETKIQALIAQNKLLPAVDTALFALKTLGIYLPQKPGQLHIVLGLLMTKLRLLGKSNKAILAQPAMTAPIARAATRMLAQTGLTVYIAAPDILPLTIFQQLKMSVKYGHAPDTPLSFSAYGMILIAFLDDVEAGYKYGTLSLQLMEQLNLLEPRPRVLHLYYFLIQHWKKHLGDSIQPLHDVYRTALETGNLIFAALAVNAADVCSFFSGSELGELEKEITVRSRSIFALGGDNALIHHNLTLRGIRLLRKYRGDTSVIPGNVYDELQMIPTLEEERNNFALFVALLWKLILSCLFGDSPDALLQIADKTRKYLDTAPGTPMVAAFYFYDSLARLFAYPHLSQKRQSRIRKQVKANQKKIKKWAGFAPMNQLHRYNLVAAEEARVLGRREKARELYDQAIEGARENDYQNEEALAWERAGLFYLEYGPEYNARFHLKNAHYVYSRWGADALVANLENRHPDIFSAEGSGQQPGHEKRAGVLKQRDLTLTQQGGTTDLDSSSLDLSTIIKASQAISSEIILDSLLRNMMRLLIENAGAQKGYFILEKNGTLYLEAREEISSETSSGADSPGAGTDEAIIDESRLPLSLLDFTMRTGEVLVLPNAHEKGDFISSEYIRERQVLSVLCVPVRKQGRVIGLLYMENNLTPGAFTAAHVKVIEILSAQIDLSIENARLYANLEDKVKERTEQLELALGDVQALKSRQDGDYYLTSLLLKPLCENTATDSRIQSDILLKQYKVFQYQKWEAEIGGDICACHDITLRGKTYTLFLNADAMGKSMQGAGGSLVLLAALKGLLGKVNASPFLQNQSVDDWLSNAYMELFQLFASFKGYMQVSMFMGIADGENKRLSFINADHPSPVLFRNGLADYFGEAPSTCKLGEQLDDPPLDIEIIDLEKGDIVLMGSDGKDDLQSGHDAEGNRRINSNKNIFLECVVEAQGEPEQIMENLLKRGDFIDDFSLLRLRVD